MRAFRRDPARPPPLLGAALRGFDALERTFGAVPAAMRYFAGLPATVPGALAHLLLVRRFSGEGSTQP